MFYALKNGGTYLQTKPNGLVADGTQADGRVGAGLRVALEQVLERFGTNGLGDAPGRIPISEHRIN